MLLDKMFSSGIFFTIYIPVSLLASCVPYLKFDARAEFSGDNFGGILYSYGGVPSLNELVFGVFEEDVGLADSCSSNEYEFEHIIEVLFVLGH